MADRAHIRSGAVVKKFNSEKGWIKLEGGGQASPVVIGFVDGNDKVVPVTEVLNDTSTIPQTITTRVEEVLADSVTITKTIRDKTQQEIDDTETERLFNLNQAFDDDPLIKAVYDATWRIAKGNVPASALVNKAAWRKWFKDTFLT